MDHGEQLRIGSACQGWREERLKVQLHYSRDLRILQMPGVCDGHQGWYQVWSTVGLRLRDELCVMCIAEPGK